MLARFAPLAASHSASPAVLARLAVVAFDPVQPAPVTGTGHRSPLGPRRRGDRRVGAAPVVHGAVEGGKHGWLNNSSLLGEGEDGME